MKKTLIIATLLFSLAVFGLTGCNDNNNLVVVNTKNSEELSGTNFGISALIEIGDGLYYDSTTRIVYWWNGYYKAIDSATTPSAYYAPNGLPYRYDPETNTFEEIEE